MAASTAIRKRVRPQRVSRPCVGRVAWVPVQVWRSAAGIVLLSTLGGLGCGKDSTGPAVRSPAQAYWALELNQHAIMLALQPQYNTAQLTATPKNALGAPFTTTGTVSYRALDSTVSVSATGLVTAHNPTTGFPARVIAALRDPGQGVTHADTAFVAVTTTVPAAITTYSMQPIAGDSAKRALDYVDVLSINQGTTGFFWSAVAVNANQDTVCQIGQCSLLVRYRSLSPLVAGIDSLTGHVQPVDTGRVVFTAQTLAYGQVLRDSVTFRIGYRVQYKLSMVLMLVLGVLTLSFLAPKKLVLGLGAVVTFCNAPPATYNLPPNNQPVDIVFDHPAAVDTASCTDPVAEANGFPPLPPTGSGNIAPFGGDTTGVLPNGVACRRFNTPGVYHYHSTLFPSDTYEIDVRPDPQ